MKWLDRVPFSLIIIASVLLGLAPFFPEPHLVEKLRMLQSGTLTSPLDIFDLFFHGSPLCFLILKSWRHYRTRNLS
ncbi:RND transporter [Desulfolithobacter sp.]